MRKNEERGTTMETYLTRLRNELDTSTFRATVGVMLQESRTAIDRQRSLIALERLARRHSPVRLNQLRILEETRATLIALLPESYGGSSHFSGPSMGSDNVVHLSVAAR
jgi:hypothetical protein